MEVADRCQQLDSGFTANEIAVAQVDKREFRQRGGLPVCKDNAWRTERSDEQCRTTKCVVENVTRRWKRHPELAMVADNLGKT